MNNNHNDENTLFLISEFAFTFLYLFSWSWLLRFLEDTEQSSAMFIDRRSC